MIDIIRHWVFESNSSSSHSFSISDEWEYETAYLTDNKRLIVWFWEFWWEVEDYNDVSTKLAYVATWLFDCHYCFDWEKVKEKEFEEVYDEWWEYYKYTWDLDKLLEFEEKLKNHTWAEEIVYDIGSWWHTFWYIDHESTYIGEEAFNDLINAVFRKKSILHTDNDNN